MKKHTCFKRYRFKITEKEYNNFVLYIFDDEVSHYLCNHHPLFLPPLSQPVEICFALDGKLGHRNFVWNCDNKLDMSVLSNLLEVQSFSSCLSAGWCYSRHGCSQGQQGEGKVPRSAQASPGWLASLCLHSCTLSSACCLEGSRWGQDHICHTRYICLYCQWRWNKTEFNQLSSMVLFKSWQNFRF